MTRAIGGHHSAVPGSVTWLTPKPVIDALGGWRSFDLDPCAAPEPRPWPTALAMNSEADGDGLALAWHGRVWLNPPYTSSELALWLAKLAAHGRGTALIFARTETAAFEQLVWGAASGLLFLYGRLHFHDPDGRRAAANAGAPSVLAAYGPDDLDRLAAAPLAGALVPLRFARFTLISGLDPSWAALVRAWMGRQGGPVTLGDAYRFFAGHPKARRNAHWRAKVRQKMMAVGRRVDRATYEVAA